MVANSLRLNCIRRHRHFKSLFRVQDPRKGTPSRKTHPNWKIERLLKQVLRINKEAMIPGRDASIDEQTIGFQGSHSNKKGHNENNEGNGFQCDSPNLPGGYTWAFCFRNQPAHPKYVAVGACPLHAHTLSLIDQITHKYHCV